MEGHAYDEEQIEAIHVRDEILAELAGTEMHRDRAKLAAQLCDALELTGDNRASILRAMVEERQAAQHLGDLEAGYEIDDPESYPDRIEAQRDVVTKAKARVAGMFADVKGASFIHDNHDATATVAFHGDQFAQNAESVLDRVLAVPVKVYFDGNDPEDVRSVAASPAVGRLPALGVAFYQWMPEEAVLEFFRSPSVRDKVDLSIQALPEHRAGVLEALQPTPNLRKLTFGMQLGEEDLRRLAAWPGLRGLTELTLYCADGTRFPDEFFAALPEDCMVFSNGEIDVDGTHRLEEHSQRFHERQFERQQERDRRYYEAQARSRQMQEERQRTHDALLKQVDEDEKK